MNDFVKILFAFSLGLITFFGGPLLSSRLHDRSYHNDPTPAARRSTPFEAVSKDSVQPVAILDSGTLGLPHQQELLEQGWTKALAALQSRKQQPYSSIGQYPIRVPKVAVSIRRQEPPPTLIGSGTQNPGSNQVGQRTLSESQAGNSSLLKPKDASLPPAPATVRVAELTVRPETPIYVRISGSVSNKQNHTGETFRGTLAAPLSVENYVVAGTGSTVLGRIVDSRKAGLIRGHANLSLELTDVSTTDGRLTKIHTTQWYESGSRGKLIAAATTPSTATGRAVANVISGLARETGLLESPERRVIDPTTPGSETLARKGAIVVPAGAEISFRLTQPFRVGRK